jgi:hypothetical protein
MHDALTLMPEPQARRILAGSVLTLRVLRPPFPALGVGALRVLRVRDADSRIELIAGYDNYERLDAPGGAPAEVGVSRRARAR